MKLLTNLQDYRSYPAIHYSLLSALDKNPENLIKEKETPGKAMIMGSIIDTLLTSPDDFDNLYHIVNEEKPTGQGLVLFETFIQRFDTFNKDQMIVELHKIKEELQLWNTLVDPIKIQQRVEDPKILTAIEEHYKMQGKTPIYQHEKEKADALLESLKTHPFTHRFFNKTSDDVDIMYQTGIVFDHKKVLLDGIIIDKWERTITPFDLKTSEESALLFPSKILKFRYDIQAALYLEGVKKFAKGLYPEFKVNDFLFVVGSFNYPNKPLVYNSRNIIEMGTNGSTVQGRFYKGYKQLINEYEWHTTTDQWQYKKEIYDNNGIVDINYDQ